MNPPELSHFTYDPYLGWYEGKAITKDGELALYLSAETENEASSILVLANSFLQSLERTIASAKSYSADRLLAIRNDSWREENSPEISKDEFISRLQSLSVTLYPNQNVEIMFRDGGLFAGHVVLVSANRQGHFSNASIEG